MQSPSRPSREQGDLLHNIHVVPLGLATPPELITRPLRPRLSGTRTRISSVTRGVALASLKRRRWRSWGEGSRIFRGEISFKVL